MENVGISLAILVTLIFVIEIIIGMFMLHWILGILAIGFCLIIFGTILTGNRDED